MADQSDVEIALQSIIAGKLYPNGADEASIIGNICRVYRGAPSAPTLGADIATGVLNISVMAREGVKNTTRYPRIWRPAATIPASLIVTVSQVSVSFTGQCLLGQVVGLIIDGSIYAYSVQNSDSTTTLASNIAQHLRTAGWLVAYAGNIITIPGAHSVVGRVVAGAVSFQEIKRQSQEFQISLWCPDPDSRDAAAPLIDQALSSANFIALKDGSFGRITFSGSEVSDQASDATLFKRQLLYLVEYPTTLVQITPAMLFGSNNISVNADFVDTINI